MTGSMHEPPVRGTRRRRCRIARPSASCDTKGMRRHHHLRALRHRATLAIVVVLGLLAIGAIARLQDRADASKQAQLTLAAVENDLNRLQSAPFRSNKATGGSPQVARGLMRTGEGSIERALASLRRGAPPAALAGIDAP